jgi:hypothetical protein
MSESDLYDELDIFNDDKSMKFFEQVKEDLNDSKLSEDFKVKGDKTAIFKINNYEFLKKKREESIKKAQKRQQWTPEEVIL